MPVENIPSNEIVIRDHIGYSAYSYSLNLSAAKALLNDNYPLHTVADDWPTWDKNSVIDLYNSNPKICWHNNAASGFNSVVAGINDENIRSKSESTLKRKIVKGLGIIYESIYRKIR